MEHHLEFFLKYSGFFLFVKIIYLLGHLTRESAFKYIFRKYQCGDRLLLESYLIMVKCYIHLIWRMNIWKVRKWWCCLFWDLWLVKVKVTIQSFLLHLSRSPPPFLLRMGVGVGWLNFLLNFQKGGAWQDLSPQISGSQRLVAGKDRADFYFFIYLFIYSFNSLFWFDNIHLVHNYTNPNRLN